ncbi:hypothetical protein Pcinc_027655, partial [Petrolisthes cinctipes]
TLLSEFNKEQEAFIKARGGKGGEALAPWVGYPDEDSLKEEILALSTDQRNFVRSPPTGVSFEFDLEAFLPVAQATLAADPNLEKMRFTLVPKKINEETFWRNYFYRVGLIRQSTELSSLEREGADATPKTASDAKGTKGKEDDPSSRDLEEVKRGVSNLTKPSEEDWEKELREELGEEYEVVGGGGTSGKDSEQWEEEIQNMIDEEDGDLRAGGGGGGVSLLGVMVWVGRPRFPRFVGIGGIPPLAALSCLCLLTALSLLIIHSAFSYYYQPPNVEATILFPSL